MAGKQWLVSVVGVVMSDSRRRYKQERITSES